MKHFKREKQKTLKEIIKLIIKKRGKTVKYFQLDKCTLIELFIKNSCSSFEEYEYLCRINSASLVINTT